MQKISFTTQERDEIVEITKEVQHHISIEEGVCLISSPHTTMAVYVNENADETVKEDMKMAMQKIVPEGWNYTHLSEGNAPAHVKVSLIGNSVLLPISQGKIVLGTWQGIFAYESDGPRTRSVHITEVNHGM